MSYTDNILDDGLREYKLIEQIDSPGFYLRFDGCLNHIC